MTQEPTQHTDPLAKLPALAPPLRLGQMNARKVIRFTLDPDAPARAAIAAALGIARLRKLRFDGSLRPLGRRDWELQASLGATVVQPCAITLEPVTTRIDEQVQRRYLAEMPEPQAAEIEMPEDDSAEPLPDVLDPGAVMMEALMLALPAFPRAEGAALSEHGRLGAAPAHAAPFEDSPRKPFAALETLRAKLAKPSGTPEDGSET